MEKTQLYVFKEDGTYSKEVYGFLELGFRIHSIHQRTVKYVECGENYERIAYDYHLVKDV